MAPQRKESTAYGRETGAPKNKESSMAEVHHIDNLNDKGCPELPASLQDLSEDEFRAMEKKMVWKVDLRMLPLVIIMYILNYLDRNNIAAARLAGTGNVEFF
ncbi:putative mfs transporter [Diplodia seriata]|uniref:Putative mfs transporter n=1 Tax=Diplodia seriata TaxID=420778 RepID=A0A0G2DWK7_9PEZI|nr:putative mfs transporter [Diplodia seriata]